MLLFMSSVPHSQPVSPTGFTVEAGSSRIGKTLCVVGDEVSIKISSRDTNGAFAVAEDRTPPMAGPPLHLHHAQDEWWYVVEGEYLFEIDGRQVRARAGDTVFAPRGSRHTFQNVGTTTGRTLVTVAPGGLDVFFEELSAAVPPGTDPAPEALSALFQKHGLELLGPPLATR